ncbi:hypothetical protein [Plantactinospora sp. KLBMP9567]|uniref:hypothetical protein n=1 Tax=Plantactinospora sp. KLBMP9567 TaxID=3085900 RepID=UPI002981D558|nr:hypothetical protein [Plantactinospora sp. KLBMP9567]MDW5329610.1 hypothetical protein [Plantactinospora sp. KLBMP9567]
MSTAPASGEHESNPVPVLPDATVAGDWTILAAIAAAVAGLVFWRRRSRRG